MKIVINNCFGGFSVNQKIAQKLGSKSIYGVSRTDERLISLIESGIDCNGPCAELKVIEIPDEATDWYVVDYDGNETILYVIDGKIRTH